MGFSPRAPWDDFLPPPAPLGSGVAAPKPPPKKRGRRPASARASPAAALAPAWHYHRLTVTGPAATVAEFAGAARGAGIVPWALDLRVVEEDIFHLAALPGAVRAGGRRGLSLEGCRILARQFCERVEARRARAIARVGHSIACPFDLHALLPVPEDVLALGSSHPMALAWLRDNWGIFDTPRQVAVLADPRRLAPTTATGDAVIGYGFFTADGPPGAAIARLGALWPALKFTAHPQPSTWPPSP
jgi:hypothetical protein